MPNTGSNETIALRMMEIRQQGAEGQRIEPQVAREEVRPIAETMKQGQKT